VKIRSLFSLATFAVGALALALMVADRFFETRELIRDRVAIRAETIAELVGGMVKPQLRRGEPVAELPLQALADMPDLDYLLVSDVRGRIVHSSGRAPAQLDKERPTDRVPAEYRLRDGGAALGTVLLGISLQSVNHQLRLFLWRGVALALAALVLLALVSWWLGALLGRSLKRFVQALERFDSSLLEATPPVLRDSELDRVLVAFQGLHLRLRREEVRRKETEKLKNDLANMMVHDLKQPLTVFKTVLWLIRDSGGPRVPGGPEGEALDMADKAVTRLSAMIEDLLQIARLSDAAAPIQKGRILLGPLLDECGEESRLIVEHSGRTFQRVQEGDAAGCWLYGDRSLIKRLIGNLILNAIDHSPQGAAVTFGARPCPDPCRVEVFVHNAGPAIPKAHLGAIFRKFATFGESVRNVGLGLAFCKMAAEKHAATIAVSSEDKTGTAFCVRFLVGQAQASAPAPAELLIPSAPGAPGGARHGG